jgi:hypothetical protein
MHRRIDGISVSAVSMTTMDHGTEPPGACPICRPPKLAFGAGAADGGGLSIFEGIVMASPPERLGELIDDPSDPGRLALVE